jgi:hypothetical protein
MAWLVVMLTDLSPEGLLVFGGKAEVAPAAGFRVLKGLPAGVLWRLGGCAELMHAAESGRPALDLAAAAMMCWVLLGGSSWALCGRRAPAAAVVV